MTPEIPEQRSSFEPEPEKPKMTSKGLPVVTEATVLAIMSAHEESENWTTHLYEVKRRLIKENPVLAAYVREEVTHNHPVIAEKILDSIASTLAVLEHQAESNKMIEKFKPPEPPINK